MPQRNQPCLHPGCGTGQRERRNSRLSQSLGELPEMGIKRLRAGICFHLLPTARICERGEENRASRFPWPGEFFLSCPKNSRKTSVYFSKPLSANVQWLQEGKEKFKYLSYAGLNWFASLSHN